MNIKSLLIASVVMFAVVWVTDFLIHAVWLSSTYAATKELWRSEPEMIARMPFMLFGQFLAGAAFTMLYALYVAEKHCLKATLLFAACIGVFSAAGQVIMFAVAPSPGALVVSWCIAYILQALLLGVVAHFVYRPRSSKLAQA